MSKGIAATMRGRAQEWVPRDTAASQRGLQLAAEYTAAADELDKLTDALERIAILDECDGHELAVRHAFQAVAIATSTLGKHPSEIAADRAAVQSALHHSQSPTNEEILAAIHRADP